jgi:hypothetical protein
VNSVRLRFFAKNMHRMMPRQRVGDFLCFAHDATLQRRVDSSSRILSRNGRAAPGPHLPFTARFAILET